MPPALSLSGRRFLVTGASGFVGSRFCHRLHQLGAEVHAVSRGQPRSEDDGLRWWQSGLHSADDIAQLLRRTSPDVVVHLSGHVTANPHLDAVSKTFESLLAQTVNLLTAVTSAECGRVVVVGSLTEPAPGPQEVTPGSPYVAAKVAASAYGRMFHALYDTPVVIARPGMAYGPGQSTDKLIPHVILSLLDGKAPTLTSGNLEADWIYIEDVVEGLVATAIRPGLEGQSVDLGTGRLTSVRHIVAELVRKCDSQLQPVFGVLPDRPLEQVRAANSATTQDLLDWLPRTTLSEGLDHTISWYRGKTRAESQTRRD